MKDVFFISVGVALLVGAAFLKRRQATSNVLRVDWEALLIAFPIQRLQVLHPSASSVNEQWEVCLN